MADSRSTQWPRYEVFVQDQPDRPHKNVGSVHAPDPEMALENARDVFVRRPAVFSLWVAPAAAILARTREELAQSETRPMVVAGEGTDEECYYVFQKQSQRRAMSFVVHTGEVMAAGPEQALQRARSRIGGDDTSYVWWVCPEKSITRSRETDVASMFAPAETKTYRRPQEYHTVTMIHDLKSSAEEEA
jgi:ring-1,2-phenylacetyl-CoA epoxidase subunit PaaB